MMTANKICLCLGALTGMLSMWDTLANTWGPAFQVSVSPLRPTHTNYHASREFTLSVDASSMLLYIAFLPAFQRTRALWIVMRAIAACYYGG